jgi:hypothetical protein
MGSSEMTPRQRIMAELEIGPMTARNLSKAIRISEKEVIAHMEHVAKSVQPPKRLVIEPPVCNKCGFVFSHRQRFSSPSRCPECRHEGITQPVFRIAGGTGQ